MIYIVDTSQLINGWTPSTNDEVLTSYGVLYELDQLKTRRRTKLRQQRQIKLVYKLLDSQKLCVIDTYQPTVDEEIIELGAAFNQPIVSSDTGLIQRQKAIGLPTILYEEKQPTDWFPPIKNVRVKADLSGDFLEKKLKHPDFTYVFVTNGYSSRIGKYVEKKIEYIDKRTIRVQDKKLEPLNQKQTMFVDQLFDPRIELVIQFGQAGSGKTLLQIAWQLNMIKAGHFKKLIIAQPPVQLSGRDRYGFFPGSIQRKSAIYLGGQFDQLRFLYEDEAEQVIQRQLQNDSKSDIEIQSFQNIRGRSIKDSVIIIDEQQNAAPGELKAFITRIDKSSKLIILGDIQQIDVAYDSVDTNGLTYVASRMYYSTVTQVIELDATLRSKLVEDQLELL